MKLYETVTDEGVVVAHFLCNSCGSYYNITPAPDYWHQHDRFYNHCGHPPCPSHDPKVYKNVTWR